MLFKSYMQFMFMARFMLVFDSQKGNCLVAVSLNDPVKTGKHGDTTNRDVLSHMIWLVGWCWAKRWHATRNKHWLQAPWSQVSYKSSRYKKRLASTRLQCVQRIEGQHPFWMICQDEFVHVALMMSPVLSQWRLQGAMTAGARRRNSLLWHLAKCVWWQMHSFNFSRANYGRSWCPKKTMPCHVPSCPQNGSQGGPHCSAGRSLAAQCLGSWNEGRLSEGSGSPLSQGLGVRAPNRARRKVVLRWEFSGRSCGRWCFLCVKICFQHFGQRSSRELLVHGENGTEVWASTWPAQDTSPGTAHHILHPKILGLFSDIPSIKARSMPLGGFKMLQVFHDISIHIYI